MPLSEYRLRRRVQFHETDVAGIVHFSWFFRYMEEAEHALWREAGLSIHPPDTEIGWPRVACSCEFFGPAKFEDEITLKLRVTKVGGKSLSYEVDFLKGDTALAKGKLTSVCVALEDATFKAIAIPDPLRQKLSP